MPSGNGVAASVLCRLGYLLGELRYVEAAERTLAAASRMIFAIPDEVTQLPVCLAAKRPGARTTAYLCTGMTCSAPLDDLGDVARRLAARISA